ncbi:uncharacterized protein LOC127250510 [Andrographis paniculata]|uniref:uncharacterized protein LOC127250510 n=1 Tax=Andrographis paniculata TaxID=175694 RepID=UPI0021E943A1|nr:uncharacterized protein LOC127250510 [Andrographis paniculata]
MLNRHAPHSPIILDITIISAHGLKNNPAAAAFATFWRRLRPYVTISVVGDGDGTMHRTRVDDKGGVNPTWGDKFRLFLDPSFFEQSYRGIYLQLYTKRLLIGRTLLGWCVIPAADIFDQPLPIGCARFLSYRLRARDGSRGHGIVNVSVKVEQPPGGTVSNDLQEMFDGNQFAIGIPVNIVLM